MNPNDTKILPRFYCFFVQSYRKKIVNKEATFEELASRYSDCSSAKKVTELFCAFMFNKPLWYFPYSASWSRLQRDLHTLSVVFHPSPFPKNPRKAASKRLLERHWSQINTLTLGFRRTWFVNIIVQENNEVFEIQ
jgi:hypothetical protein